MPRNPLPTGGVPSVGPALRSAAREASPWIERLARLGYAARGVVYLLVGYLAVRAALSPAGGGAADQKGALRLLDTGGAGRAVLAVVALGLAGFALWRAVQAAVVDAREEHGGKLAVRRIYHGISGLLHLALALEAARLALRKPGGGSGDETRHWTAEAMQRGWGRYAVIAAGAILIGVAIKEIVGAFARDFAERVHVHDLDAGLRRNVERLGRFGTAARGVVFGISGWFVLQAGLKYSPSEARGLGGVLDALGDASYGQVLLGLVALGLIGFGVWQFVKARYMHLPAV
ncbi:MAG TPA: DUF1206 domain-containing protein [Longimicrobium sp.]|nr:DUF1206 domain-containing protein [Longimicrobium sp.]